MNPILLIVLCQIILESFPVSSSGHLVLLAHVFQKFGIDATAALPDFFDHFLHGPTVLILMIVFFKEWWQLVTKHFLKLLGLLCLTTSFAAISWFGRPYLKYFAWYQSNGNLLFGFCLTACVLASLRLNVVQTLTGWLDRRSLGEVGATAATAAGADLEEKILNFKIFFILGIVQALAFLQPGLSRFASVYATTRFLKIEPRSSFSLTFLIQMPLIVPGFVLGLVNLFLKPESLALFDWKMNLTIFVATIVAYFGLLWMKRLAEQEMLWRVAFYMLIPILIVLFL